MDEAANFYVFRMLKLNLKLNSGEFLLLENAMTNSIFETLGTDSVFDNE